MGLAIEALVQIVAVAGVIWLFFVIIQMLLRVAINAMNIPIARSKPDDFSEKYGYSFSYVFVFAVMDEDELGRVNSMQKKFTLKKVCQKLENSAFEIKCFYSAQKDEVYVKVRAKLDLLLSEAQRIKYNLCLDPDRLRVRTLLGKVDDRAINYKAKDREVAKGQLAIKYIWAPIKYSDEYTQSKLTPFDHIYGAYEMKPDLQSLFKTYGNKDQDKASILRGVDRIRLMLSIFMSKPSENPPGCDLYLEKLQTSKCFLAAFSLHEYEELHRLQRSWLTLISWPMSQPFDGIADYYGEKVGFYFVFLGYYAEQLIYPSIIGLGVYGLKVALNNQPENFALPLFSIYIVVWSSYFLEGWKQVQITQALRWGVTSFEENEQDRPNFKGEIINSPVDGSETTYFSDDESIRRSIISHSIVLLCICGVIASVAAIFFYQLWVKDPAVKQMLTIGGIDIGGVTGGLLNSVVIILLNVAYSSVAIKLNDFENHRTETKYEDALITKIFVFQMINSYSSLFFIAFIQTPLGFTCAANSCTGDVASNVSSIFISRLISANIVGILQPKFAQMKKAYDESQGLEPGIIVTPIEKQYTLPKFDVTLLLKDYAKVVIQYGYAVLFVAAFPLAPLMAFLSIYVQIRVDGWKLLQLYRRPEPRSAEDIGTWQSMLEIISYLSVMTNIAMVTFTGKYFINFSWNYRWIFFLAAEHFVFICVYLVDQIIPDIPIEVEIQIERQEFLTSKVLKNEPDDDEPMETSAGAAAAVDITDTDNDWLDFGDEEEEKAEDDEDDS